MRQFVNVARQCDNILRLLGHAKIPKLFAFWRQKWPFFTIFLGKNGVRLSILWLLVGTRSCAMLICSGQAQNSLESPALWKVNTVSTSVTTVQVDRLEDELYQEQEKLKAIADELEQTFAEMSGY